jgi:methyl-accepting chemotaxis protein
VERCVEELATKVVKIDDFLEYSQGAKDHMSEMMKMMQRMEATIVSQASTAGGQKRSLHEINDAVNSYDDMETEGNSQSTVRQNG